jgi:hypothetical protein
MVIKLKNCCDVSCNNYVEFSDFEEGESEGKIDDEDVCIKLFIWTLSVF